MTWIECWASCGDEGGIRASDDLNCVKNSRKVCIALRVEVLSYRGVTLTLTLRDIQL